MIAEDLAGAYVTEAARFRAARPDLADLAPMCGDCAIRDDGCGLGTHTTCPMTGEHRQKNSACNTGGFVYDARPLWEQYPWISQREWQYKDGMLADTMRRISDHVAKGGSLDDLRTIRLRAHGIKLIFPPGKPRDEYGLSETAYTDDAYADAPDLTQAVRDRQAARAKGER